MDFMPNFFGNLFANMATQFMGAFPMSGALIIILLAPLGCFFWHRRRIRNGKTGVEPSHIIAVCLVIASLSLTGAAGAYIWQQFFSSPTVQQPSASADAVVLNAQLLEGGFGASENPLIITGAFAKGGKSIRFAIDVQIDMQNRGSTLRRVPRIRIDEATDFVRGQAVNIVVVSYFRQDRLTPMWGQRRALSGIDDETFNFTSFVKAEVFAIDEDGHETRILGFTLFPKLSGVERMNEMANRAGISPEPTWRNFLVYRDGSLRNMDSIQ
jgi:hypothetical protein